MLSGNKTTELRPTKCCNKKGLSVQQLRKFIVRLSSNTRTEQIPPVKCKRGPKERKDKQQQQQHLFLMLSLARENSTGWLNPKKFPSSSVYKLNFYKKNPTIWH